MGDVAGSTLLSNLLVDEVPGLTTDTAAHESEHSLEVLVPFLQARRSGVKATFVCVAEPRLDRLLLAGRGIARAVSRFEKETEGRVALLVSSDLSHYLAREENGRRDRRALEALLAGDPEAFYERVVKRERITMCGVLPATILLEALRHFAPTEGCLLAHADSSEASGDAGRVVGYAAVVWSERETR